MASKVFERGESFDPTVDTHVRVAANRLRSRLRHYYRTDGKQDPVLLQLKKGSYAVAFRRRRNSTASENRAQPKGSSDLRFAVLPLHNLTGDPSLELLCDGIAEEAIHALSKVTRLRVIDWNSSQLFKGAAFDLREISRQLRVDVVLEGSVRQLAQRLRVAVQLVETAGCCCIWSKMLDVSRDDLSSIPGFVAEFVAANIPKGREAGDLAGSITTRVDNPETLGLFMKGRHHLNRRTEVGMRKGAEYFGQIISDDPNHIRAHAALAELLSLQGWYCYSAPDDVMPSAKASAMKAVRLDPRLAEGHLALGLVSELYERDWRMAKDSLALALDLNASSATIHFEYGFLLCRTGELSEGIAMMRRALELDPLSPVVNTNLGVSYYYQREYEQAVRHYLDAIDLDEFYPPAYYRLAQAYIQQARLSGAQECVDRAIRLPSASPVVQALAGYTMAKAGRKSAAQGVLATLLQEAGRRYTSPVSIAIVSLGLGDHRAALDWLRRGVEANDLLLVDLRIDPMFDSLRETLSFQKLLMELHLA
ncbi:MAG: tetratricopeptide repeat protein [Acidobacteriota bacterium]